MLAAWTGSMAAARSPARVVRFAVALWQRPRPGRGRRRSGSSKRPRHRRTPDRDGRRQEVAG
jgi:hypothetical protein